jgi:hypothetical protein
LEKTIAFLIIIAKKCYIILYKH